MKQEWCFVIRVKLTMIVCGGVTCEALRLWPRLRDTNLQLLAYSGLRLVDCSLQPDWGSTDEIAAGRRKVKDYLESDRKRDCLRL
jgi:hypothetical protein